MRKTALVLALFVPLLFSACATMSLDRSRLAKVQRVAIVGFSVNQQMPPSLEWNLGGKTKDSSFPATGGGIGTESPYAGRMYELLSKKLKTELGWVALEPSKLAKHAAYAALFDRKMTGLQNRPPKGNAVRTYGASGIIDAFPMARLSHDEREALRKALGVDALIVCEIDIQLEQGGGLGRLVGAGELIPKARLTFHAYDRVTQAPAWQDVGVVGARAEKGAKSILGIAKPDDVLSSSVGAAESAYQALVARYRKHEG